MTIGQRISTSWEREGLQGILQRSALYLLRRLSWRADAWTNGLDHRLNERLVLRRYKALLKRNEIFRNRHKGQRCFVIGNGPSLNGQDLAPLANEITFVSNYFHHHPIISESWQPKYYCLTDPSYFDGREPIELIRDIIAKASSASFFVPHYAADFLSHTKALPEERTFYVGLCGGLEDEWTEIPDFTRVTPGVQTVVQLGIMAGMFMGCSTIYLMGLDHDWLSHGGMPTNFYNKEASKSQVQGNVGDWDYKSLMLAMTTIWRVYEMHRRIAEKHGIKIVNLTNGGFLDVFERARYEDVF